MTRIERNKEIFRLYHAGGTEKRIAKRFGIWSSDVEKIAYSDEAGDWKHLCEKVRQNIRKHDDIDRKLLIIKLLDALQLSARPRNALRYYYERQGVREVSLKEFMDLVVLENPAPNRQHGCIGMTRICKMGKLGVWNILEQLTTLDLGENARIEWVRKLELLRKYGRQQDLPRFVFYGFEKEHLAC